MLGLQFFSKNVPWRLGLGWLINLEKMFNLMSLITLVEDRLVDIFPTPAGVMASELPDK